MQHPSTASYADRAWHGSVPVEENVPVARDTYRVRLEEKEPRFEEDHLDSLYLDEGEEEGKGEDEEKEAEPVVIDTYPAPAPDRNPLFLENRVYQGSSGRVYPEPVTDRVSDTSVPPQGFGIQRTPGMPPQSSP